MDEKHDGNSSDTRKFQSIMIDPMLLTPDRTLNHHRASTGNNNRGVVLVCEGYRNQKSSQYAQCSLSHRIHPPTASFELSRPLRRWLLLVRHSSLRRHGVLSTDVLMLLLLHIVVRHLLLLFGRDAVLGLHPAAARHASLLCRDLCVTDVFGRVNRGFAVDAILVASRGFGRIQACLRSR